MIAKLAKTDVSFISFHALNLRKYFRRVCKAFLFSHF